MLRYQVCGIDDDGATELYECDTKDEGVRFVDKYVSSGDAGNWTLIEVYDRDYAEDLGMCVVYSWDSREVGA